MAAVAASGGACEAACGICETGLAERTTGWRYWAIFAAINICLYAVGSWWIFRRLVPRALGQQGSA